MKDNNSYEDVLDLDSKSKIKSKFRKSYNDKFNNLHIKHEHDNKKYIILVLAILITSLALFSSSYAYLTYTSKTNNSTVINAGKIEVTLKEKDNALSLYNALPMKDETGIKQEKEYQFIVKNIGDIATNFNLTLNSFCTVGETYKINKKSIKADKCLLDEYIKIGIKIDKSDFFEVVSKKDMDKYIIDTGYLNSGESVSYTMKMWLSENTPNIFNSKDSNTVYIGSLGVDYEQGI